CAFPANPTGLPLLSAKLACAVDSSTPAERAGTAEGLAASGWQAWTWPMPGADEPGYTPGETHPARTDRRDRRGAFARLVARLHACVPLCLGSEDDVFR